MGLGFLAHGYATGEFEVTDEKLGVYLCTASWTSGGVNVTAAEDPYFTRSTSTTPRATPQTSREATLANMTRGCALPWTRASLR